MTESKLESGPGNVAFKHTEGKSERATVFLVMIKAICWGWLKAGLRAVVYFWMGLAGIKRLRELEEMHFLWREIKVT